VGAIDPMPPIALAVQVGGVARSAHPCEVRYHVR
jgi:hypothetical protein